jgi:hypothetical protein
MTANAYKRYHLSGLLLDFLTELIFHNDQIFQVDFEGMVVNKQG